MKKRFVVFLLFSLNAACQTKENHKMGKNVYKILTEQEWLIAQEKGTLITILDKNDGFIHLSTAAQLAGTLSFFFAEYEKVFLLQLKQSTFKQNLIYETPYPEGKRTGLFPHLYSDLKVDH